MRKSDSLLKFILLTTSVVLLSGSTSWAVKSWQQLTTTAITGTAFYDCNGNSVRNNNEPAFPNMTATLCGRTTAGDSVTLVRTTDSLGHYTFVGLAEGKFSVKFSFPNGTSALSFTAKSADVNGSDAHADGTTDFFLIDGLRDVEGIDVGIIDSTAPIVSFTNPFLTPYNNGDTITVECDNLPTMNASWAAAQDNSGQVVSVQFFDFAISINDCKRTGYITILHCIWRSTDVCGNSGEKTVFIKIKDSKPPVLSGIPTDILVNTVRGERVPTVATGISARDNCTQNLASATFQETQTLNTCGRIITRTWSVSDDCGNIARGSQHITVISDAACSGLAGDTLRFTLSVNGVLDTCLNLPIGSRISTIQHCSSGQQGATITLTASNCLKVTPSLNFVGRDTFCARVCDVNGQNCHDMLLFLTIQGARFSSCELLSGMHSINLMPMVCGQKAPYCIIGTTDIRTLQEDYTLTDNGLPYTGGLTGCQFDTIFSYNYFAVPDMGTTGPYRLDTWQLNGTTRQIASFQNIQELADSMNRWDPMGNWRIDPSHFTIYGGDMRSQYGQMHITRLANSAFATLTLNTGLISNGVKICFTTGSHTLIFQNNVTGCADTLRANVFCQNERIAPIALNDRVSTAKNTALRISAILNDTLNGVFDNIIALNQPLYGSVGFQNNQMFLYTPATDYCGQDTFDYRVCNTFGLCDTASIFIDVTCNNDTTGNNGRRSVALDDAATTRMNTPVTLSVLANDSLNGALIHPLSIIRFQTHGSATLINNNQIVYTPTHGFCNGLDSFDYEICNANGCDTGRVVVTVTCESDTTGGGGARKPVAVDDVATTRLNTPVTLSPLANDTLNGALSTPLSILRFQMHGAAIIQNNQIIYTPTLDYCGGSDTLEYVICNANGCDTARFIINITCENDGSGRPVAIDDRITTRLDSRTMIPVLANDIINGFLRRGINIIGQPNHGTSFVTNNQIVYMPNATFCGGNDTLAYEICNAIGCDTANVIIAITCNNDTTNGNTNRKPIALNDTASTGLNRSVTILPLANDTLNGMLTRPLSIIGSANHGLAFIMSNQIIYMPEATFCGGNDTLNYEICNTFGCDTGQIIVAVSCDNGRPKPIAIDDVASTLLNTPVTISVLTNDTINGSLNAPLSIVRFQTHGVARVINNQIIYTPSSGYCNDKDTLEYQICNANGCDTARLIISIFCDTTTNGGGGSGRPIVAVNDNISTPKNTSITFRPTVNDTIRTKLLSLMILNAPQNGTIAFKGLDTLLYTPSREFCGRDTLQYTICDTSFMCTNAFVFINVTCDTVVNGGDTRKPTALNDFATTQKDRPITIAVLANDSTFGTLTRPITVIRSPINGTTAIQNNQIVYTPNPMFCGGQDTLTYEVCNTNGCDTADIYIAITCDTTTNNGGSGRPVVAVNDNISTPKNGQLTFKPTLNDTVRTRLLALMVLNAPRHGTISFTGLDTLLYVPNRDYCGRDTLEYSICDTSFNCSSAFIYVNVTCDSVVNGGDTRKPTALNDFATTQKDRPITITVLANDSIFGTLIRPITVIRSPVNGTTLIQNNQIVYTPNPMFCGGQDTLTYEVCNTNGCDTADIYVSVTCDTTTNNGGSNRPVVAVNDNISTRKNVQLTFKPTLNDTVRTRLLALMVLNAPRHGTISFTGLDTLLYAPNRDYCGRDTLEYSICDTAFNCSNAFIYVNVTCDSIVNNTDTRKPNALNDFATTQKGRPVTIAVLANDSTYGALTRPITVIRSPKKGSASIQNNQIIYTPNPTFCGGQDSLTYEICNTNGCDTANVYIAVTCDTTTTNNSNRPIVAVNDHITTRKNTSITFRPTLNDTIRTKLLALMILNPPRNGTLGFTGLDTLLYTPNFGFCGRDTFEYSICDTSFNCASAFIYINITCDSTGNGLLLPIAVPDYALTRKLTPIRIAILANDTLNGVLDSIRIIRLPQRGVATLGNDSVLTYSTDTCGFIDTVIYRICNRNGCDTALVAITVRCQNDTTNNGLLVPIAINDTARTAVNQAVVIAVLQNDTLNGVLRRPLSITGRPRFGTALVNANNEIVYTPQAGFCGGKDTLIYDICNTNGCATAIVVITVICDSLTATRQPIAVPDYATTPKNTPIIIPILANDTLNGTLDSIKIIRSPFFGIASLDINNILTYTPDSCGFTDSLIYRICNRNGCDTAIVRIKVICDTVIINTLAPIAIFDTAQTPKGQTVTIRVTLNDTLRGADTFRITRRPIHGLAMFDTLHQIAYIPEALYCGRDTLIYEICNQHGCDTALVTLTVTCDIVPPVLRPVAVDDYVRTLINRQVDFVILSNDTLRGARSAEMVSPPKHGTIIIMPDSLAMYKPDHEFCGLDSFMYRICNVTGCDTAIVRIDVSCGDSLQVFRGFSPNGDNRNDAFVIRGIENYPDNEVVIFNRWGTQVFTRKGYRNDNGWDGSWGEKYVPDGTYFYFIRLNDGKNQQFSGYVQLVR